MHRGKTLHGFCNGFFGRDSYGDKVIEGEGSDWIVVRENGIAYIATFDNESEKDSLITEWIKEYERDQVWSN